MRIVLEEQGINTWKMNAEEMCDVLNSHPDFKNKFMIEHFFFEEKNIVYMLPKFDRELNPIERVWAQAKCYACAYCKYNIKSLWKTVTPAFDSVT